MDVKGSDAMAAPGGAAEGSPIRALILDDDAFDRRRLRRMISDLPISVTSDSAATLDEMRHCVRHRPYDVVFVDYGLAEGTGLDALAMLRGLPDMAGVHCIMVTGEQGADVAAACFRSGCRDYISKAQLTPDLLATTLHRLAGFGGNARFAPAAGMAADAAPFADAFARAVAPLVRDAVKDALRNVRPTDAAAAPSEAPFAAPGSRADWDAAADTFIFHTSPDLPALTDTSAGR